MVAPRLTGVTADVLALLLQAWDDGVEVHGWLLIKSVRRCGPTVYQVLDRLEDAGWVSGSWEVLPAGQKRPRRRYYRLTAAGVAFAAARLQPTAAKPSPKATPKPLPQ